MDVSLAQRGPSSPGQRVPRKVAILPREVAIAARNYQNSLSAPLAHDRGAPHTQLGHPDIQAALSARLDQVSPRCWLVIPSPRRREAARAHHARAECAERVWVGIRTLYSTSLRRQRTRFIHSGSVLRRAGTCGALESLVPTSGPQHKPYVRAGWARVDRMAYILHPQTRGFPAPSDAALTRAIPASLHAPHSVP